MMFASIQCLTSFFFTIYTQLGPRGFLWRGSPAECLVLRGSLPLFERLPKPAHTTMSTLSCRRFAASTRLSPQSRRVHRSTRAQLGGGGDATASLLDFANFRRGSVKSPGPPSCILAAEERVHDPISFLSLSPTSTPRFVGEQPAHSELPAPPHWSLGSPSFEAHTYPHHFPVTDHPPLSQKEVSHSSLRLCSHPSTSASTHKTPLAPHVQTSARFRHPAQRKPRGGRLQSGPGRGCRWCFFAGLCAKGNASVAGRC